jgi:short-subunit dehydrogenase
VRVQALCPGFTRTEIYRDTEYERHIHSRVPRFLWMTPDAVVRASLTALARGRSVCIPGLPNRVLVRLAGGGLGPLLAKLLDRRVGLPSAAVRQRVVPAPRREAGREVY